MKIKLSRGLIARASITINVPIDKVWDALVNPDKIIQYMFGTNAVSDWKEGSSIVWKGEWHGKKYEDRGMILKLEAGHMIQYSHFSPLSGQPDLPENYHIVTIELSGKGRQTLVSLLQDNNSTEEAREHSERNWNMMLEGLKKLLEK
ncbi:MAG TPA: SRPBCC domain-containing protein [Candidatus Methanoperedens sp.]